MFDKKAAEIFDKNINMMVPWYLMASYAYYKEDDPILSDQFFDNMAKVMLDKWEEIEHFHKHFNWSYGSCSRYIFRRVPRTCKRRFASFATDK